jgi:putative salt-induced outer membrane protein
MTPKILAVALLAVGSLPATATDWSGSGELGVSLARGNTRSDNLNGKLELATEDAQWKHAYSLGGLRARGETRDDFDGDGDQERRMETSANRWEAAASSALKANDTSSWVASLRHERDDFAAYSRQSTAALGYGHQFAQGDAVQLRAEVGPGVRHARDARTQASEREAIVRGQLDYKQRLTGNTEIYNTVLVESGDANTFAQNDVGVAVAMNASLALKAGVQLRHNTQAGEAGERTDSLTTLNLVYRVK